MEWNLSNQEMIETIDSNYPDSRYTMLRETLDYCKKLLERDTPEDVMKQRESEYLKDTMSGKCPICNQISSNSTEEFKKMTYCPNCGKKLKWRNLNEES